MLLFACKQIKEVVLNFHGQNKRHSISFCRRVKMSWIMENDNEPKQCNLDISFDLSDFIDEQIGHDIERIQHESYVEFASDDNENNCVQTEETNENVHGDKTCEVSLNVSFDYSELEPISTGKELFSISRTSSKSLGIYSCLIGTLLLNNDYY